MSNLVMDVLNKGWLLSTLRKVLLQSHHFPVLLLLLEQSDMPGHTADTTAVLHPAKEEIKTFFIDHPIILQHELYFHYKSTGRTQVFHNAYL